MSFKCPPLFRCASAMQSTTVGLFRVKWDNESSRAESSIAWERAAIVKVGKYNLNWSSDWQHNRMKLIKYACKLRPTEIRKYSLCVVGDLGSFTRPGNDIYWPQQDMFLYLPTYVCSGIFLDYMCYSTSTLTKPTKQHEVNTTIQACHVRLSESSTERPVLPW